MKMRIVAIHRYYWPDRAPYASILRRIVNRWTEEGHEVTVLSAQPTYGAGADKQPRRQTRRRG